MHALADLHALAQAAGLRADWFDASGQPRRVAAPTLCRVLDALGLPAATPAQSRDSLRRLQSASPLPPLLTVQSGAALPAPFGADALWLDEHGHEQRAHRDSDGCVLAPLQPGYWTLLHGEHAQAVAVAPPRCHSVADACAQLPARAWGLALQVYSARSAEDGGIGDADGAAAWVRRTALAGGTALALSPLHAARPVRGYPADPYSPYSPSDRRFLDPVHAAPQRVLGDFAADVLANDAALAARLQQLQAAALIDWPSASQAKLEYLRALHAGFSKACSALHQDLAVFRHAGGSALAHYADFAAADFADGDPDLHLFGQWLAARSWQQVPLGRRQCCTAWDWALRRMRSMTQARHGTWAVTRRRHCAPAAMRHSLHCCAR
jgi:4-alpha-glucanotransferase